MTIEVKLFALNLQGFESCTEVRGSNVMQKYYFISLLPNFWATFSDFPSNFVVLGSFTFPFSGKDHPTARLLQKLILSPKVEIMLHFWMFPHQPI
jgi:hypothetical protein